MVLRRTVLEQLMVCQRCTKRAHHASRSSPGASKMSWCRFHENVQNSENVDTVSQGLSAYSQSSIFSTRPHKWTLHILFESLMKKSKNIAPGWARACNHSVYNDRFTNWAMGPIIVKVNCPFIFQKLVFWIPKIGRACGRETRYFSKASLTWKFSLARRAHYICKVCTR